MGSCCASNSIEKQSIHSIVDGKQKEIEQKPHHVEKDNYVSELDDSGKHQNSVDYPNLESNVENQLSILPESLVHRKEGDIHKDYKFLDTLGKGRIVHSGGFGEVRKATHRHSGLTKAVKIMRKQELGEEERERLINEDHPNVIKVFEFYEDKSHFYIVSELCTGGELFERIIEEAYLSEKDAVNIMKQILSAVFHCHNKSIVHRDLKPENVLYESKKSDSIIKIIDFGISRSFKKNEKMHGFHGTVAHPYLALLHCSRSYQR